MRAQPPVSQSPDASRRGARVYGRSSVGELVVDGLEILHLARAG